MTSLDATLMSLTSMPRLPVPIRLVWRRRDASVRGLSLRDLLTLANRHRQARETVWRVFGLSREPVTEPTAHDIAAVLDIMATALDARSILTTARLVRLPQAAFDETLSTIIGLTVPSDVDALFEPGDEADRRETEDFGGAWTDPAVTLIKVALRFDPAGSALDWTPGRILFAASVTGEHDAAAAKAALVNSAVAARLGQADEKGWKRGFAEISR